MKSYAGIFTTVLWGALFLMLGCDGSPPANQGGEKSATPSQPATQTSTPTAAGWGTIRGRLVFAGDKLPEKAQINVNKDTDHCLSKGPILSERWTVNPENRGIRWAVVFLKPASGQKLPIHDTLKEPSTKEVILDQPVCAFDSHVIAVRKGQKLLAKNSAPIVHNVVVGGRVNTGNVQIPMNGGSYVFELLPEPGPVKLTCGAHPWMEAFAWIFDHPYYAVTDADGNFEIKLAPAGPQNLVIWQEAVNYVPDAKGRTVEIKPGAVVDLGEIAVKPPE